MGSDAMVDLSNAAGSGKQRNDLHTATQRCVHLLMSRQAVYCGSIAAQSYLAGDNGLHKESKHCKHGQPAAQMSQVSTHSTDKNSICFYHAFQWGSQAWV